LRQSAHGATLVKDYMNKRKIVNRTLLGIVIATVSITYLCNRAIVRSSKGHLYADTKTIPYNRVGLLLGTSKAGRNGYNNPYYDNRIQAALKLIQNHKIKYLIISGDNSRKDYNEPEMMKADLVKAGIDSSIIYLDFAGFRTFDSVKRLKEIFGQDSVTVISQQFHNERAIYIASKEGIAAIGFNAADVSTKQGLKTQIREKMARVKVFVDYLFGIKPKFLGDKVTIPT
jgi:SanA protein